MITAAKRCMTRAKNRQFAISRVIKRSYTTNLGIIFRIPCMQGDGLEIQTARFTIATMFHRVGTIPSTAVICCCSRVKGTGVEGACVVEVEGDVVTVAATLDRVGSGTADGEGGLEGGCAVYYGVGPGRSDSPFVAGRGTCCWGAT